jgi:hypothetical protein
MASHEMVRPTFRRHIDTSLRAQLIPEREHFAEAGNAEGKRYTAFNATCDKVRARLRDGGPVTMKQLVAMLGGDHHYASDASAVGSLRTWIDAGKLEGVELVNMGKGKPNIVRLVGQALPVGLEPAMVTAVPKAEQGKLALGRSAAQPAEVEPA